MKFSQLAIINALLATSVIAAPQGQKTRGLSQRLARRAVNGHQGYPKKLKDSSAQTASADVSNGTTKNVQYSSNWAGAVITSPPTGETFNAVYGTFTVPTPSVPSDSTTSSTTSSTSSGSSSGSGSGSGAGSGPGNGGGNGGGHGHDDSAGGFFKRQGSTSTSYAASAWVGIDGDTYSTAILQTGIDFTVTSSGDVSYDAWYEWYPDYAYDFELDISAGDVVTLSVVASTTTAGTATIENQTTGKTATIDLTSTSALGGENAEWIVEDFEQNGEEVNFADFGTVVFSNATAATAASSEDPTSATILDIEDDSDNVLTDVTVDGSTVTVTYL